jgi:hypothetical protein
MAQVFLTRRFSGTQNPMVVWDCSIIYQILQLTRVAYLSRYDCLINTETRRFTQGSLFYTFLLFINLAYCFQNFIEINSGKVKLVLIWLYKNISIMERQCDVWNGTHSVKTWQWDLRTGQNLTKFVIFSCCKVELVHTTKQLCYAAEVTMKRTVGLHIWQQKSCM